MVSYLIAHEILLEYAVDTASQSVLLVVGIVLAGQERLREKSRYPIANLDGDRLHCYFRRSSTGKGGPRAYRDSVHVRSHCDDITSAIAAGHDPSLYLNRSWIGTTCNLSAGNTRLSDTISRSTHFRVEVTSFAYLNVSRVQADCTHADQHLGTCTRT